MQDSKYTMSNDEFLDFVREEILSAWSDYFVALLEGRTLEQKLLTDDLYEVLNMRSIKGLTEDKEKKEIIFARGNSKISRHAYEQIDEANYWSFMKSDNWLDLLFGDKFKYGGDTL